MNTQNKKSIYQKQLLDHFHNPRGKADLTSLDIVSKGHNPMCGDEINVGLFVNAYGVADIRFRGRGCSVCLASASIMVETLSGLDVEIVKVEHIKFVNWITNKTDHEPINTSVIALDAVRLLPARKRCVILAWEALGESLDKLGGPSSIEN